MSRERHPRRADILRAIISGWSLKEIADAGNMTPQGACKWAAYLGFRRMYVSDDERRQIIEKRKQQKWEAA